MEKWLAVWALLTTGALLALLWRQERRHAELMETLDVGFSLILDWLQAIKEEGKHE